MPQQRTNESVMKEVLAIMESLEDSIIKLSDEPDVTNKQIRKWAMAVHSLGLLRVSSIWLGDKGSLDEVLAVAHREVDRAFKLSMQAQLQKTS